ESLDTYFSGRLATAAGRNSGAADFAFWPARAFSLAFRPGIARRLRRGGHARPWQAKRLAGIIAAVVRPAACRSAGFHRQPWQGGANPRRHPNRYARCEEVSWPLLVLCQKLTNG